MLNLNSLPYDYDPNAGEPIELFRFFDSIKWEQDLRDTFQLWCGLQIVPDTHYQKLVSMPGPPRSGKGTLSRLISGLVGRENVCSPSVKSLGEDRFALESAVGKLSMIMSESRPGARTDLGGIMDRLLQITGEDPIDVQRKHKPVWHGVLSTRITILTNGPIAVPDSSGAFLARLIVLPFTESFAGKEDLGLGQRLTQERGAILKWAMAGYRRLQDGEELTQPASGNQALEQQKRSLSPVYSFAEECLVEGGEIEKDEMYKMYRDWCVENGHRPKAKNTFGADVISVLKAGTRRSGGYRAYTGYRARLEPGTEKFMADGTWPS